MKYLLILLMLPVMGLGQKDSAINYHVPFREAWPEERKFAMPVIKDTIYDSIIRSYNNLLPLKKKFPFWAEGDTTTGAIIKWPFDRLMYNTLSLGSSSEKYHIPFIGIGDIEGGGHYFEKNFPDTSIFDGTNSPQLLPNASVITLQDSIREDKYQKLAESAAEVLRYVTTEGYVLNKNRVKFNIAVKKHLQLLGDKSKYKKMQKLDILVRDIHGKAIGWVPQ